MKKKRVEKFRFEENSATIIHPDWREQRVGLDYVDRDGKRFYRKGAYEALSGQEQSAQVRSSKRQADAAAEGQDVSPAQDYFRKGCRSNLSGGESRNCGKTPSSSEDSMQTNAATSVDELTTPAQNFSQPITMTVIRFVLNPWMLLARDPETAAEQHVVVGDASKFVIGGKIKVIRHPQEPAFWKLYGPLPI